VAILAPIIPSFPAGYAGLQLIPVVYMESPRIEYICRGTLLDGMWYAIQIDHNSFDVIDSGWSGVDLPDARALSTSSLRAASTDPDPCIKSTM
jgi:hypothetical protein